MAATGPGAMAAWLAAVAPMPAAVAEAGVEHFERHVRPVLVEHCVRCHSGPDPDGGLRLDSRAGLLRGGDSGPAIFPGDPERSLLIRALRHTDKGLRMPPKAPRPAAEIAAFEAWVRMGAPDPRPEDPAQVPGPRPAPYDRNQARTLWSFRPIADPPVPPVRDRGWPASAIDAFVLARLEERGLAPAPPADRRTLIRRATYDLTGLPPTPAEVRAFLADTSPDAFARVVDRLLASPAYGERWGRHWLDVVRYADTSGCNSDFPVPEARAYRDWVIRAFNDDKPYDAFVREQIAGDRLGGDPVENPDPIIATGYLAISRRFGSRNAEHHLTIEDTIDNLGKALLGLSVSCARCHDHKFDPIPQADYYALYGIFESTRYPFPGTEVFPARRDLVVLGTPADADAVRRRDAALLELSLRIEALEQERKALPAADPGRADLKARIDEAKQRLEALARDVPTVPRAYAVSEGVPADARLHRKGDPENLGDEIPRGFLQALGGQRVTERGGSGRRELAGWLTGRGNPLLARVMVNRIWQHHFGKGIVQTPNDFGTRGKPPTHPELLDHLASRFMDAGWSVKAMHRLIMLSRTYQMSAADRPVARRIDPGNELLWRFERRRLAAEEIRDSLLAASGALEPGAGPGHPFPDERAWRFTQHEPFLADYPTRRRSVYMLQQRIRRHPFVEVFDGADPNSSTAERPISTTALQALFLMNDPFIHEQAALLAGRVAAAVAGTRERLDELHWRVLARPASRAERAAGAAFLAHAEALLGRAGVPREGRRLRALASYTRLLFATNEFLYLE